MTAQRIEGSVIAAKRLPGRGAERPCRLLLLVADLAQRRDDLARDERQRDEDRRDHHRREREEHLDSVVREPGAEPAVTAVEQVEREPDDDGRERERKIDERVDDSLAAELAAHDRDSARDPEDSVGGHRDGRDDQRQLEGVDRLGRRKCRPCGIEAVLEGAVEDDQKRPDQDRGEVRERNPTQPVPADGASHGRASSCSAGRRRSRAAARRRSPAGSRRPLPRLPGRHSRSG